MTKWGHSSWCSLKRAWEKGHMPRHLLKSKELRSLKSPKEMWTVLGGAFSRTHFITEKAKWGGFAIILSLSSIKRS